MLLSQLKTPSMDSLKTRGRTSAGSYHVDAAGEGDADVLLPPPEQQQQGAPSPAASLGRVMYCVAVAGVAALAFGYHLGVVNGPLAAISADLGVAGNAALQGLVVSSLLMGAMVGSLGGSSLADRLGRRRAFLLDTLPLLAGAVLSATAQDLRAMVAGRVLAGVGIGLSSALVPLYISEVAPTHLRGTLGSVNQLLICLGILAALVVNVALPAAQWRAMFWLAAAPAAVLALGMLFAPESPTWLKLAGRTKEAEETATLLWGPDGPVQLGQGKDEGGAKPDPSWGEVLGSRATAVGMALFVFQQFSGINAIVYFSSSVFEKAGIQSGALASAAVGVVNVLGTVVATGLMDRTGRKRLLSLSFGGMGVAMLAMAAGLSVPALSGATGAIALLGTIGYIAAFSLGAGPVPGLLVPEITSARIRGRAVSLALGTHWVCNFAIGQAFLGSVTRFGVPAVYLFFSAVCFACVMFVRRSVVETKGRSFEDIERQMAVAGGGV